MVAAIRRLPCAPALALLLAACSSAQPVDAASVSATPPGHTPAGQAMTWVLETLNGAPVDRQALEARFDPTFLAVVPAEDLESQLGLLADEGPYHLDAIEAGGTESHLSAYISAVPSSAGSGEDPSVLSAMPLRVDVVTSPEPPFAVVGLGIRPAPYRDPTLPQGWAAIDAALRQVAPNVGLLAAELVDGECRPVHGLDGDRLLPLGSAFKLYVLGALVEAVAEGRVSWDDSLPIDPALRSPSSMALRDLPDGEPLTLRQYAEPMIAVSDNTATDQLIHHLGRERVEAVQARMGHSHPDANVPFLTTREMMVIKVLFTPAQRQAYVAGDVAALRALLIDTAEHDIGTLLWATSLWVAPRMADQVEWFASGEDLCRAMLSLREMGETDAGEPVRHILSQNPGTAFDPTAWTYIGYKGGSEPGVLNFTWLLERADGRWFVAAMSFLDNNEDIALEEALRLAAAVHTELARTP